MDWIIWTGAAVSLIGVAGLLACIAMAMRARGSGLGDDELRERLRRVVAWNMAALAISALGLMAVVVGIILG